MGLRLERMISMELSQVPGSMNTRVFEEAADKVN